jgi:hypothetical protein
MLATQEKTLVEVVKNDKVSTFYYRIKVAEGVACAYDFDGIFCEECPNEYKGSDDLYYKFLCTANPLYYPDKGYVPLIITGRHEKYREVTDRWLKQNDIYYGYMLMRDFEIPPTDYGDLIARYKAKAYKEYGYDLFIESRLRQAKIIHEETEQPVFCPVGSVLLTNK